MAGIIEVKDQGKLRIYDADNSNYVDIVVPSTVSSNRTITLPDASFTVPQETNATHSGEVTGSGALTIADNIVDEANLKVSNTPTNGYMLTAQSGNTGGLTWAEAPSGVSLSGSTNNTVATVTGANALAGEANLIFNGSTLAIGSSTATNNAGTPNLAITAEGCMVFLRRANSNGHLMNFANTSGGVTGRIDNDASNTTYATSSDYRLKENIDYNFNATTRLKQLKPARFNFIIDETNTLQDGFLAHEVSDVVPKAVLGTKDATETYTDDNGNQQTRPTYQSIDHSMLVPLLVKTIQELEARITTLENA